MASEVPPRLVRAIHNFKGKNNDELCFKKGDILTVTQALDGGWWEGTLQGNTGWFPSNYVKDHKLQGGDALRAPGIQARVLDQSLSSRHRNMVFKDILDTEASHVHEMRTLTCSYLQPLEQSGLLSEQDFRTLVGNLASVLSVHTDLLEALEAVREQPSREQRVGGAFLQLAAHMKATHLVYCANHPRAVQLLDRLNSSFPLSGGGTLLALTTGLSRPFRRLDKYPALLTELQRHTEESHLDRGDTQRSVFVYKEMAASCSSMRRQKELELEVLAGTVEGCQGEELQCLGELLHVGPVVLLSGEERRDFYLALFSTCLVQLSLGSHGRFSYQVMTMEDEILRTALRSLSPHRASDDRSLPECRRGHPVEGQAEQPSVSGGTQPSTSGNDTRPHYLHHLTFASRHSSPAPGYVRAPYGKHLHFFFSPPLQIGPVKLNSLAGVHWVRNDTGRHTARGVGAVPREDGCGGSELHCIAGQHLVPSATPAPTAPAHRQPCPAQAQAAAQARLAASPLRLHTHAACSRESEGTSHLVTTTGCNPALKRGLAVPPGILLPRQGAHDCSGKRLKLQQ
ncbi:hypothetical protein HPB48_001866 [Haemaphysalis longicornis]|uniref:Guanine nucleotide exchange factor n=1 Tax=Haemaphysalis longicornis TaxID=44386 RepID=A0A9J6G425_HAELO|nr:hypothetical protein HPB48_001866 [Haemaphysalis longicornis]